MTIMNEVEVRLWRRKLYIHFSKQTLLTAKHDTTMIGKAMYKPTSNASVFSPRPELPGTIPPSDAALISSSDASHDFIFSSKLIDVDGDFSDEDSASPSTSTMWRGWTNLLVVLDKDRARDDDDGEKP